MGVSLSDAVLFGNSETVRAPDDPRLERLWPTPDAMSGGGEAADRKRALGRTESGGGDLIAAVEHWPTPAARDYKGENGPAHLTAGTGRKHLDQLPNFVAHLWATPRTEDGESCGNHPDAQDSLTGQTRLWATPNVPNGGRTGNGSNYREDGSKQQIDLGAQTRLWQTPQTDSFRSRSGDRADEQGLDQQQTRFWPTPTAEPYGSSQNGINGIGGTHERPSANTPSLERLSRSFPRLPAMSSSGRPSSATPPSSRPRSAWKTPHGIANTDRFGKTAGGGGEFHKQAMAMQETLTPRERRKLNPLFVEWLMGLPHGHTAMVGWIGFARAGTAWSRWWQQSRSAFSRIVSASGLPVADSEK